MDSDPRITICNTAICEACDKLHDYFARVYGVHPDDADTAIESLESLPKGMEPMDDDDDRLQYWKSLRRVVEQETPTHLLAF